MNSFELRNSYSNVVFLQTIENESTVCQNKTPEVVEQNVDKLEEEMLSKILIINDITKEITNLAMRIR